MNSLYTGYNNNSQNLEIELKTPLIKLCNKKLHGTKQTAQNKTESKMP